MKNVDKKDNDVFIKNCKLPVMAVYAFNPTIWEAEAGGSLCLLGQPGLHSGLQVTQSHIIRPCLGERGREG